MVTLITTIQLIMTDPQTADSEGDRQVFSHYASSVWTGYVDIRVTINPFQSRSPVLV